MLLVGLLFILIPGSLLIWFANVFSYIFSSYPEPWKPISPSRWVLSFAIPLVMVKWSLKRKSLDGSGASMAFLVGFVMTISNYCFTAALLTFFVLASKATKFRSHLKRKLENEFKEGGQRNWIQVLCNGGVATEVAIVYMIEAGCGEYAVDFSHHYTRSWLVMSVLGAVACSSGDTFSSEIGSVVGSSSPRMITTLRRVPKGTNGAVSLVGTLSGVLGGLVVGLAFYGMLLAVVDVENAPPQWPIIALGAAAGCLGSLVDSFLGATVQFSGLHEDRGCIVDDPGQGVTYISGTAILDNHSVNLLASVVMALVTPNIAFHAWRYVL